MNYITKNENELIELFNLANHAYYNDGEPIISDEDFNTLETEMERRGINTTELKKGSYGEEVEHFTLCPSLKKVNIKGDFNKGHHADIIKRLSMSPTFRQGMTFTLHYKLDGLAINAMYKSGELFAAATRGDYRVGRNVINKVRHLLPQTVENGVTEVRYECVIPMTTFKDKYMEDYSHPRNLASGILNDEDISDARKNDLKLIPLNGVQDGNFINETLLKGSNLGDSKLTPSEFTYDELIDFDTFKGIFDDMHSNRPTEDYPTDGLVLSPLRAMVDDTDGVKYPNHSVSIKFPPNGARTTVESVEWNLKKSGEFVPIVNLTPIKIDGRMISKTHGFNYGFILANGIEKGAVVEIEIAGDIIPYLSSVVTPSIEPIIVPTDSIIDGCHCLSNDADAIKLEKFIYSALKFELKDFGGAFYRSVASYFDYDPFNMFDMESYSTIIKLMGIGITKKTATKFIERIKGKTEIKLKDVIIALAIDNCGEGTSEQVAKYLAKEHYSIDPNDFDVDYDFARKQKDVIESCTNGDDRKRIITSASFLKACGVDVILADAKNDASINDVVSYLMTGSPKSTTDHATKGAFKKTLPPNYIEVKSMSKANLLITDDLTSNTTKMKDAKKKNINIKTYAMFCESDTFMF